MTDERKRPTDAADDQRLRRYGVAPPTTRPAWPLDDGEGRAAAMRQNGGR